MFFILLVLFCWFATITNSFEKTAVAEDTTLPDITITSRGDSLLGIADSATQGTLGSQALQDRPIARPVELLETVPGLIITQHSGGGKANQYYLRGFNLDHGSNFAFFVDGVPTNLPSHTHGQGYADLNWLIPELVESINYEKGVYYSDQGDFANAGSANVSYMNVLPQDFAQIQAGGLGFYRGLVAASPQLGKGHLLYAIEAQHNDGAWLVPNNYKKFNGFAKYSVENSQSGYSITGQGYYGTWFGNDQVPQRAISDGIITRFGSLDPSTGGSTQRYSLYGEWHAQGSNSSTKITAYFVQYHLDLFSNFTYFLDQTNGDEIEQKDSRVYTGVRAQHTVFGKLFGRDIENTFGLQIRQDWILTALNHDSQRVLISYNRADQISEFNLAPWYQNKIQWLSWLRTVEGIRTDFFGFTDNSDNTSNSGQLITGTINPKASLIFGPWYKTEFYAQGGFGFRTNDARSIFTTVAPGSGASSRQLPALVRTRGAETGIRSSAIDNLVSTLSVWSLWSDSETFFDGDTGAVVDADRPGVRYGAEWNNIYSPLKWLFLDADLAYSWAFFTDTDPVGPFIPDSITSAVSAGISVRNIPDLGGLFSSFRFRQFGPRPLIEDNSRKSSPSLVCNLQVGYNFNKTWTASVELLNVFDAHYNDAEYYYSSRLQGEPPGPDEQGGYTDHMVHPGEPRSLRTTLVARF